MSYFYEIPSWGYAWTVVIRKNSQNQSHRGYVWMGACSGQCQIYCSLNFESVLNWLVLLSFLLSTLEDKLEMHLLHCVQAKSFGKQFCWKWSVTKIHCKNFCYTPLNCDSRMENRHFDWFYLSISNFSSIHSQLMSIHIRELFQVFHRSLKHSEMCLQFT